MPLWNNQDNAANSDIAAVQQYNMSVDTANQALLYANSTADAFVANLTVGQFAVSTGEVTADPTGHGYHSGWVLRKEGAGLRAGRVTYETLVAGGSITGDGTDDTQFPDYRIVINTQPSSNSAQTNHNVSFTVVASSLPTGATLSYKWQQAYAGAPDWADLANTAETWYNVTSRTLIANVNTANANTLRAVVSTTGGATTLYTTNASVTLLP